MFHKTTISLSFLFLTILLPFSLFGQDTQKQLTWRDCVRLAISNNLELKQARESVVQADADKLSAISSYIPSLSGNYGYSISKNSGFPSQNNVSLEISGKQLIFDGLATVQSINRTKVMRDAAILNYKISSAGVRQKLRSAYADYLTAKKNIQLTGTIFSLRQNQYEVVKFKYVSGNENEGALKESEADLFSSQIEVTQARTTFKTASKELGFLLGKTNSDLVFTEEPIPDHPPADTPDFPSLSSNNIKTKYYSLLTIAAKDSLNIAYGQLIPSISLSGSAGLSGSSLIPDNQPAYSIGISAGIPIFQGNLYTKIKSSKSQYQSTIENQKEQLQRLRLDLEEAWLTYLNSFSTMQSSAKYLEAATERSKIADAQYSTGLITFDTWATIQNSLVSSEKNVLDSSTRILKNEAAWTATIGGTLENEIY